MDPNKTCRNCKFWALNPQDIARGFCRRFPPVFVFAHQTGQAAWSYPETSGTSACGEHQGKLLCVDDPTPINCPVEQIPLPAG